MRTSIESRGLRKRSVALLAVAAILAAPAIALASHQFSDVPDGHAFHYDIDALVDAGVTSGCGGGKFCPNAYVTRGQMAAFLNRLGALAPDKTPVVNADRLDGMDGLDIAFGTALIPSGMTVTGYQYLGEVGMVDNAYYAASIALPGRAPVALTSQTVNFAPHSLAADDDATCTGTADEPTAPAGKVCVYIDQWGTADGANGQAPFGTPFDDRYFLVQYQANAPGAGGSTALVFTWAYTAP